MPKVATAVMKCQRFCNGLENGNIECLTFRVPAPKTDSTDFEVHSVRMATMSSALR